MLFPTLEFALFFFLLFPLYWLVKDKSVLRKGLLIVASYFFYGYWDVRFIFLLFLSSLINWLVGLKAEKRLILALGVGLNLSILFFFKYADFLIRSLNNLLLQQGREILLKPMGLILPVGISFFTFQGISYIVDVHRGDTEKRSRFSDILLYISFFPQLVAGPILRSDVFLPQIDRTPDPSSLNIGFALRKIFSGLFKKIVIANYLASLAADPAFLNPGDYGSWELLFAAYAYGVQIFCDFSAYSDIAIGVANLLGFHFPENFDKPYRSSSLKEFWRRWHISLSSWLRDYLYIPLGGSRKGKGRTYLNLFLTMLLGGIWHGAGWNFVLWGCIHGFWLIGERLIIKKSASTMTGRLVGRIITFHVVTAAWIFFRAPDFPLALNYFQGLFAFRPGWTMITPFTGLLLFIGIALHFIPPQWEKGLENGINRLSAFFTALFSGLYFILLQILAPEGMAPFIYFQF
ncbi:MAG: MBOAT family protein [Spirochaetales bacterium]|nr:MBOAT family protein [Spirochaetales bacterium]